MLDSVLTETIGLYFSGKTFTFENVGVNLNPWLREREEEWDCESNPGRARERERDGVREMETLLQEINRLATCFEMY